MVLEITNENFGSIIEKNKIVVIDFWATWCGPCRTLGPIVDSVELDNGDDDVVIGKADVDSMAVADLASKFSIRSIPSILFFKDGEVVERTVGVKSKLEIEDIIKKLL